MTNYIRKLRAGRVANANVSTWVGENGTIFYDEATGQFKIADGVTPGGHFVNLVIATTTVAGAIKAGPGANVAADGTLTINTAGLPLSFGDFTASGGNLTVVNPNENLNLVSNGTGEINIVGNLHVHSTYTWNGDGDSIFSITNAGFIEVHTPVVPGGTGGALNIIGSSDGSFTPISNPGSMIHVTGNDGLPTRITFDNYNNGNVSTAYPSITTKAARGTAASPAATQTGDFLGRWSAVGWQTTNFTPVGGTSVNYIGFRALENYSTTNAGSQLEVAVTPVGSNVRNIVMTVSTANATVYGNLVVSGIATVAGNVSAAGFVGTAYGTNYGNVVTPQGTSINSDVATLGNVTAKRFVVGSGGIRSIQDGIWANLSFANDSIVHLYQPSGTVTVNLSDYVAGSTIRLLINMAAARAVNLGVLATNSTNGSTQLQAAKISNNQAVQIVYTCIDGTSGNCHAALTYA